MDRVVVLTPFDQWTSIPWLWSMSMPTRHSQVEPEQLYVKSSSPGWNAICDSPKGS